MKNNYIKAFNPLLAYVNDLMNVISDQSITIPADFHTRVAELDKYLSSDISGLINPLLDFAVECALVDYTIETDNENFTNILNEWLNSINSSLRGKKIEVGIQGLAKQYFKERWKKSSLLVLRTTWKEKDGFILPDKLWFVNGGSVQIKSGEVATIGGESYFLKTGDRGRPKQIPSMKNEELFVQSPYGDWGEDYPTPFLVQRGILRNLKFLYRMQGKSEKIIGKALEYIFLMKKGSEALLNNASYNLGETELKDLRNNFKKFLAEQKTNPGLPAYFTNFDTTIEHLIPEYSKALNSELYAPIEKKLLCGMGFIDIVDAMSSSRKESVLNPKPFIREVRQGVKDFKALLTDLIETIREKNSGHKKYTGKLIKIKSTPITDFISDKLRDQLRQMFGNGNLSRRTYIETCGDGNLDYDLERKRRKKEKKDGDEKSMYPHLIQNQEQHPDPNEIKRDKDGNELSPDKQEPNNKDYDEAEIKILELAPYKTISELPANVKNVLPKRAQQIWLKVFNDNYAKVGEDRARKIAWIAVKQGFKKDTKTGKWKKKKS